MTEPDDRLGAGLRRIAGRVESVDLYERSLARSRQIGRRRAGASTVALVALAAVGSWQLVPAGISTPVDPAKPADLGQEALEVGAWPKGRANCPTGHLAFRDGMAGSDRATVWLQESLSVDLDGDRAPEVVAMLVCLGEGGVATQLMAYRGRPGAWFAMGQVVGPLDDLGPGETTEITGMIASERGVRVWLASGPKLEENARELALPRLSQWRTFRWNGNRFTQIGGPTSFLVGPDGPKVTVTTSPLRFGKPEAGCRTGTMTLTLRNTGTQPAARLSAVVMHPDLVAEGCPGKPPQQQDRSGSWLSLDNLAPGETRNVTVTVVAHDQAGRPPTVDASHTYVELRIDDRRNPDRVRFAVAAG